MNKWQTYFMDVARRTAELSYAERLKVGAVVVKDKRIVCIGFNGTPEGLPNTCECDGKTLPSVLHAEENMILFAAKNGISLKDCSVYITHAPCINCARMIYGAGIKSVVYWQPYRCCEGLDFLESVGVIVSQHNAES